MRDNPNLKEWSDARGRKRYQPVNEEGATLWEIYVYAGWGQFWSHKYTDEELPHNVRPALYRSQSRALRQVVRWNRQKSSVFQPADKA